MGQSFPSIQRPKDLLRICYHTTNLPGHTLFLPTIINNLSYTTTQAQLLSIPLYAASFIRTMGAAILAEKTRQRAHSSLPIVGIFGYIILLTSHWQGVSYVGMIVVVTGIHPSAAVVLNWPANNILGQTKRLTVHGMQLCIGSLRASVGCSCTNSNGA